MDTKKDTTELQDLEPGQELEIIKDVSVKLRDDFEYEFEECIKLKKGEGVIYIREGLEEGFVDVNLHRKGFNNDIGAPLYCPVHKDYVQRVVYRQFKGFSFKPC